MADYEIVNGIGTSIPATDDINEEGQIDVDLAELSDIGEALADGDKVIVDNASGGAANNAVFGTLARIWTYISAKISATALQPRLTIADSATTAPMSLTERAAAPSSPVSGDIYLDDGTNTASGNPGWRRYNGAAWEDISAAAGGAAWDGDITDIDLDGGTDIGAALADADLILVDDGAAGTNRKSALSRVWTYISAKISASTIQPRLTIADSATTAPMSLTERAAAPSSPVSGDIYLDDGTNTASGDPAWRRYTGAAWEDILPATWLDQDVSSGSSPTLDAANITGVVSGSVEQTHINVRKGSAGTILQGRPVYMSGYNVGGWIEVEEADNTNAAKMPAIGVAEVNITNTATVEVTTGGRLTGLDTSAYSDDDPVWVGAAAPMVNTRPTGSALVQKMGIIARSHASAGVMIVVGAGRTNDVPNFTAADKMWYGGTDGVKTEATLTAAGRALMDDATAADQRATLGISASGGLAWEIITANDTAVSGEGFLIDAGSGAVALTLPAGSVGDEVGVKALDITNAVTVVPNGTDKIEGVNATYTVNAADSGFTLVYSNATYGWVVVTQIGAQAELVTLTDAATIAVDMSTGDDFKVTLAGNRTVGNPTNLNVGQTGHIVVYQDNPGGSRTLAWSSNWQLPGGTAPTLTTTAGASDVFAYWVETATRIHVVLASLDSK